MWDSKDCGFLLINTLIEVTNLRNVNLNSVHYPLQIPAVTPFRKKSIRSGFSKVLSSMIFLFFLWNQKKFLFDLIGVF